MRVFWSTNAMADRDRLFDYVAEDSVRMAVALDERVEAISSTLELFPEAGRIGQVAGSREFVIQDTPYIAYYAIRQDHVRVLRVLHQSRRPPKSL